MKNILITFSTFTKVLLLALLLTGAQLSTGAVEPVAAQTCATTTTPATTYGQVTQSVNVTTAGTYRVWSRIKAPSTTSNSYYFQVDSGCAVNVGDASSIAPNTWTWVNYKDASTSSFIDVALTAGMHQLAYTGKEADVQLDRILLLSDTSCIPTGTGDNCATDTTPVDATAPAVSITAPTSGSTVTAGAQVAIAANATDAVGVTKVEFYVDGALKSTDASSPYAYTWDTTGVAAGVHGLTARAYDAANNTATSTAVTVTVNSPPTPTDNVDLSVTSVTWSPASPVAGNQVTFSAVVKNNGTQPTPAGVSIGLVFKVNGTSVTWTTRTTAIAAGASTTLTATGGAAGTATWNATQGTHTVLAHVDDVSTVAETDEDNNTLSASMVVAAAPVVAGDGDANGDKRVNAIDLSIVISRDGQNYPAADFNKDGTVGAADMAILLSKWTW